MRGVTRRLLVQDNLEAMASLPSRSVALVYMDPPFFSGRNYEVVLARQQSSGNGHYRNAFSDHWRSNRVSSEAMTDAKAVLPARLQKLLTLLASATSHPELAAYLAMMAPRLFEARRVLRDTGSLYLHCDTSASHYLRILLDAIFGRDKFRNEIVWRRTHAHSSSKRYGPAHDIILFYSKGDGYTWNQPFVPFAREYVEQFYSRSDERGPYQLITCTAPGDRIGTRAHYEWHGRWPPPGRHWAWKKERMEEFESQGRLFYSRTGVPRLKRYLSEGRGVALQDVWADIKRLDAHSKERLGFETQKPVALLQRIISASSSAGDVVLDPFCGTGTTVVAAELLRRSWIGIDTSMYATSLALGRVRQEVGGAAVGLRGVPDSDQMALRLRDSDPLAFGAWGAGMLATVPTFQDLDRGIVAGVGTLGRGLPPSRVASWIPIRRRCDHQLATVPQGNGGASSFVLKADESVGALTEWVRNHTGARTVRQIPIGDLVCPDAVKQGLARSIKG